MVNPTGDLLMPSSALLLGLYTFFGLRKMDGYGFEVKTTTRTKSAITTAIKEYWNIHTRQRADEPKKREEKKNIFALYHSTDTGTGTYRMCAQNTETTGEK